MTRRNFAWLVILLAAISTGWSSAPAVAADFDFYVLSLSWSPSYCEAEGQDANRQQCDAKRPYAFIVHGLWPQFEHGWPQYCATTEPDRVPDRLASTLYDIIPSAGLIGHQWRKHGSCTGLSQKDYFRALRVAHEHVAIPERFRSPDRKLAISPDEAETVFIDANPGLEPDGIAISCNGGLLREVRICMTRKFGFRACNEVDRNSCSTPEIALPPPSGG